MIMTVLYLAELLVILAILTGSVQPQAGADTCPLFGTQQESSLDRSTLERIFLNFEAPSQCKGNVTSWRFCYYQPADTDYDNGDDFGAMFIIYRRMSPTSDIYVPVTRSITSKILEYRDLSSFGCLDEPATSQFEIQENDIVGACIWDQSSADVNPLLIVGDTNDNDSNHRLYQLDRKSHQRCQPSHIDSIDTMHSAFTMRDNLRLHLYANIVTITECRAGNNPPASTAITNSLSGTYLNIQYPAMCSDHITEWHYCYYTSAVTAGQMYTMTVAVWRLDSNTNTYNVISDTIRIITLEPVATLAKIFCIEETLHSDDYVQVSQGDVIGIVLPSSNPIPLIGSDIDSSYSLIKHSQDSSTTNLPSLEFTTLNETTLHLYTTLEFVPIPPVTTAMETDMPTMESDMPTTETDMPTATMETTIASQTENMITDSEEPPTTKNQQTSSELLDLTTINNTQDPSSNITTGLGTGDIAAIVLTILVIWIILVLITLFVVICRNRSNKSRLTITDPGFDNVIYGTGDDHVTINKADKLTRAAVEETYESIVDPYSYSAHTDQDYSEVAELNYYDKDYSEIADSSADRKYNKVECVYHSPLPTQNIQQTLNEVKHGTQTIRRENPYQVPAKSEVAIYSQLKKEGITTIHADDIEIGSELGSGQFGTVNSGRWKQTPRNSIDVAIKTLNSDAGITDRIKFLQEAAIMGQFRHPNVIALYGVSKKNGKRMIIVELLVKGDLCEYLKDLRPDPGEMVQTSTPTLLLQFSQHISLGMTYLADRGFVHRDLAARNILISENLICKIADFGMSRDLEDTDYYVSSGGKVPLKWTAPEAIHYKKYSTASDVWSYGCVLYEIWSLGHKPHEGRSNMEVLRKLDSGECLPPPPGCPIRVYELMVQCWAKKSKRRPMFRDLLLSLVENETVVLHIPPEAINSHPQAIVLGAPLEAGQGMYKEIQNVYLR